MSFNSMHEHAKPSMYSLNHVATSSTSELKTKLGNVVVISLYNSYNKMDELPEE